MSSEGPFIKSEIPKALLTKIDLKSNDVRYLILVFVQSCDDYTEQRLKEYAIISDNLADTQISMYFLFLNQETDDSVSCKMKLPTQRLISDRSASWMARVAGFQWQRSAIYILDVTNEILISQYDYLLEPKILQEVIEVLAS